MLSSVEVPWKLQSVNKNTVIAESSYMYNDILGPSYTELVQRTLINALGLEKTKHSNILSKKQKKFSEEIKSNQWSRLKQQQQSQKRTQNIAKMIRYMRIQSDPDSYSGWD